MMLHKKQYGICLLCFLLVVCLLPVSALFASCGSRDAVNGKSSETYGDVNGDGAIGAYDLVVMKQYLDRAEGASSASLPMADVNGDQQVSDADLQLMLQYAAGAHTTFPICCSHEQETLQTANGTTQKVCDACGHAEEVSLRVAYLPLDNRPVNQERVQYLAQSAGIELVMPEEQLYRTALDQMEPNENGLTIGDRQALLAWLREVDKTCSYFVISLDQALSGGLVGSRWLDNTDLQLEYEIADEIISLCQNNTVVLFDTVMRLASTVSYQGYSMNEYAALRSYGQVARKQLTGEALTIENIIAGYRYDANGRKIQTTLSEAALEKYHASRIRKLKLADYILRSAGDALDFIYIGVDDSTPQTTIQSNEIRYLTELIGERGVLSAAADELGLCCLTRLIVQLYGHVELGVTYYGPGKNLAADDFDIGTLSSNLEIHLQCLDVTETDSKDTGLQALILTRGSTTSDRRALMDRLRKNLKQGVPTLLMDVSGNASVLAQMIFEQSDLEVGLLFGYSSWNTAANAMGISLSQAIARYAYLSFAGNATAESNEGFLKAMTFSYIKDISYKQFHASIDGIQNASYPCSVPLILRRLNASRIWTSLSSNTAVSHAPVSASNFRYPWNRTFEMTFDIHIGA